MIVVYVRVHCWTLCLAPPAVQASASTALLQDYCPDAGTTRKHSLPYRLPYLKGRGFCVCGLWCRRGGVLPQSGSVDSATSDRRSSSLDGLLLLREQRLGIRQYLWDEGESWEMIVLRVRTAVVSLCTLEEAGRIELIG